MFVIFAVFALLLTFFLQGAGGVSYSIELGAGSIFSDVMVVKISYYRALAKANPVTWDDTLQNKAIQQAVNCGLEYDASLNILANPQLDTDKIAVLCTGRSNHLQHWSARQQAHRHRQLYLFRR